MTNQLDASFAEAQKTILDLQTRLCNAAAQIWQLMQEREMLASELAELKKHNQAQKEMQKEAPKLESVKDGAA